MAGDFPPRDFIPFEFYWEVHSNQEASNQMLGYDLNVPLADRVVGNFLNEALDKSPGKQLRVLASLVYVVSGGIAFRGMPSEFWKPEGRPVTYKELLIKLASDPSLEEVRYDLSNLRLRVNASSTARGKYTEIPYGLITVRDYELPYCLQDLADEINEDVHEAACALDDPGTWYSGVDEGIEPVPDDHVDLVIWALQRELNRETRSREGQEMNYTKLPPVSLAELPRRIQRALVERRRLRFQQWGIGYEQWESGKFSFWDIPEDPGYVPRRSERMLVEGKSF